jgi:hypothetical protein
LGVENDELGSALRATPPSAAMASKFREFATSLVELQLSAADESRAVLAPRGVPCTTSGMTSFVSAGPKNHRTEFATIAAAASEIEKRKSAPARAVRMVARMVPISGLISFAQGVGRHQLRGMSP